MTKKAIIKAFITAWQPVFDAYPKLSKLPVYAWGRYYKYELAGEAFESYFETYGFRAFESFLGEYVLDWQLLEEINQVHNQKGGELWTCEWGDFTPDRTDMVKHWNFDSRGGKCVILVRKKDGLDLEVIDCDSPE